MNTSAYFSVALPGDTTDDQLSKCYEWGKQHCVHCNLLRTCDDEYLLIAHRNDEKDLRARQRRMLTNLRNWGIDTGKQKGWIKLLTPSEYDTLSRDGAQKPSGVEAEDRPTRSDDSTSGREHTTDGEEGKREEAATNIADSSLQWGLLRLPSNLLYNGGERFAALQTKIPVC